jgi:hypothetical protein
LLTEPLSDFAWFIISISQHRSASSLKRLDLSGSEVVLGDSDSGSSVQHALRPLFALGVLEVIKLDFAIVSTLDDRWLEDAAKAWPSLEWLSLSGRTSGTPRITLAGLAKPVKHCPRLSFLELLLDAKPVNPDHLVGVSNTKIRHLTLGASPIDSPVEVFRSLTAMFPCLQSVSGEGPEDIREHWETVNALLEASALTASGA